eukprot:2000265-Amphidinium_carterae.1
MTLRKFYIQIRTCLLNPTKDGKLWRTSSQCIDQSSSCFPLFASSGYKERMCEFLAQLILIATQ